MRIHFLASVLVTLPLASFARQSSAPVQTAAPVQSVHERPAADIPKFKSRSELVLVPVVVMGKHDERLSGIPKAAFHLEQNGKEQTIASVEEIRVSDSDEAHPMAASEGFSNLPFGAGQQARVTIMVLDLFNSSPLQRVDGRDELVKFVSKDMKSRDPISLLCITNKGVKSVIQFSTDREAVVTALKALDLGGFRLGQRYDAIRMTLDQLKEIGWAYAGVPGRKTMIWLSGTIPHPAFDLQRHPDSDLRMRDDFDETRKSLLDANIAMYPVGLLAAGSDPVFHQRSMAAFLETMLYFGDGTGGHPCLESNGFTGCLNEAIEDSHAYYMLSYAVGPDDRKPGWRDLKVKVDGIKATVRARAGFYYDNRVIPDPAPVHHEDEIAALASPIPATAVRFNVRVLPEENAAEPGPSGDKKAAHFLLHIPLDSLSLDPARTNSLDLETGVIALDQHGKEAGESTRPLKGNPTPEALKELAGEGVKVRQELALAPGKYDVRFFVRDNSTGEIGTVLIPFEQK